MSLLSALKAKLSHKSSPLKSALLQDDSAATQQPVRPRGRPDVFLNELAGQLKIDLENLARDPDLFNRGIWQIKLESGQFESSDRHNKKKSYYVYLSVPDTAGFLMETLDVSEANSTAAPRLLRLVRAKQVAPLMADFSGAPVRPNIIVAQGQALDTFEVIENDTIRSQSKIKTFSVERCSEMLITLAFDAFEAALQQNEEADSDES